MENLAKELKKVSFKVASLDISIRNRALKKVVEKLSDNFDLILNENEKDLKIAKELLEKGQINKSIYARLKLDVDKLKNMVLGVEDLINLEDPINRVLFKRELDENLILHKISCPIGVLCVIFESRPDVIAQISALVIKSGNCVILKGGKESINTNKVIYELIVEAISEVGYPKNAINLVYSHNDIKEILNLEDYIDLIIPRGSNELVKYIKENTKIPVLGHASGICHIFIDKNADFEMVKNICIDSKTQYPSACNSVETLLIHRDFVNRENLKKSLKEAGIKIIENPENWSIEYCDTILSIKTVNDVYEAIDHINKYGSHHTDTIISNDSENVKLFMDEVDSANVYNNASTRFSDGFRYGFGAEVGISTNKTHSRGPVGLDGLTIYKYKLFGKGQIVEKYVKGEKKFTHKNL